MKRPVYLILLCSIVILAGCVTMIPIRLSPALYPRLGVIAVYPDEASLSVSSSFFGFPKDGKLPLPGLGTILSKTLAGKLAQAGYQVEVLPVTAEQFWSAFAAAAETKEGSGWHLGVNKNIQVTIANLQKSGLSLQHVDAVLVAGPMGIYADSRFLSRDGTGVELSFIEKTPEQVGVLFGVRGTAINARSMELTGGGGVYEGQGLVSIPVGKTLVTLSDQEKADLIRQLGEKSERVFEKFATNLR